MFTDVIRDAARQYRRRPLAAVIVLAANAGALLNLAPPTVQALAWLPLTILALVVELFVIAWLAGVLDDAIPDAREALRRTRAALLPGVRATLLLALYEVAAVLVAALLFGSRLGTSPSEMALFMVGAAPLVAFALAFLAVLYPPLLIDGERRVLRAARHSRQVASKWFPICLLIRAVDALGLAVNYQRWSLAVMLPTLCALSLLHPFVLGMANALYVRTRTKLAIAEQA